MCVYTIRLKVCTFFVHVQLIIAKIYTYLYLHMNTTYRLIYIFAYIYMLTN